METTLANLACESDPLLVNWDEVLQTIIQLTKYCQDEENRTNLIVTCYDSLRKILAILLEPKCTRRDGIFVEAFRFLRNSVVECRKNQDAVGQDDFLYQVTKRFLQSVRKNYISEASEFNTAKSDKYSEAILATRCSLQFLANSMVNNSKNTATVVTLFMDELDKLLNIFHDDEKIVQYAAMIIHLALKTASTGKLVSPRTLEHLLQNLHLEFVVYTMETFILSENFIDIYEILEPDGRIRLMNFLNARSDLVDRLDEKVVELFKCKFIERSDFILRSKICDRDNAFCWEIAVLLETLCSISLTTKAAYIKLDPVLITTVLCLLKQIDEAGKRNQEGDTNVFTTVDDLSKLTSSTSGSETDDDIRAHPTFQFKAHMIRLIANLAHQNAVNQNKVRDLQCLPIILDCCKIDARNPFIAQWSVLAIRNLCEGNAENQAYISDVQRVDTENLLPKLELIDLSK